jgi:hypothetical protein
LTVCSRLSVSIGKPLGGNLGEKLKVKSSKEVQDHRLE